MQLKTILLMGFGLFFLGVGAIGLILPILPTTPFVLLSVACFSSAPRIKARIMKIPFLREHVVNYERRTGLSRKTVWISLGWLWGTLLFSMVLMHTAWVFLILFVVGFIVTCHILRMAKSGNKVRKE